MSGFCHGCGVKLPPPPARRTRPRKWCSESCRKHQYDGNCVDCGARTNGFAGPGKACLRCLRCARVYLRETYGIWDRERVIEAVHAWADEHGGVPPVATDWNPALARQQGKPAKAEKFYRDQAWPHVTTVNRYFGGWNEAIRAAGMEPRRAGCYGRENEGFAEELDLAEMYGRGFSVSRIAGVLGVSAPGVAYQLRKQGVELRSRSEAQRLRRAQELAA